MCEYIPKETEVNSSELLSAVRAVVLDIERVSQEADYAARRARERLTMLELKLLDGAESSS